MADSGDEGDAAAQGSGSEPWLPVKIRQRVLCLRPPSMPAYVWLSGWESLPLEHDPMECERAPSGEEELEASEASGSSVEGECGGPDGTEDEMEEDGEEEEEEGEESEAEGPAGGEAEDRRLAALRAAVEERPGSAVARMALLAELRQRGVGPGGVGRNSEKNLKHMLIRKYII